ncbi:MAG: thioredoxin [Verrucomicrobiota bacterium]
MSAYINGTDENFETEVIKSKEPVLVDFWAPWCGPCRMIAPVVEELAQEYQGRAKVVKVDVDTSPMTATRYGITSIPSLMIFKGGEVVDQALGAVSKRVLVDKLNAQLK